MTAGAAAYIVRICQCLNRRLRFPEVPRSCGNNQSSPRKASNIKLAPTIPSQALRHALRSGESIAEGSGLSNRQYHGRCALTSRETLAASAAPRFGASPCTHALNQQVIGGFAQSSRQYCSTFNRDSSNLASEVFPEPHGPLIATVRGVDVALSLMRSANASAYGTKPKRSSAGSVMGRSAQIRKFRPTVLVAISAPFVWILSMETE